MILKEEFQRRKYWDILEEPHLFDISYLYDRSNDGKYVRPRELVAGYMSQYGDDLFIVLDLNCWDGDVSSLCTNWDAKLSRFSNFGSAIADKLRPFRYNMIQIILYTGFLEDQSQEASLDTSRKILLPYSLDNDGRFVIPDSDAIELPFYLVSDESIGPDPQLNERLHNSIPPQESSLFQILTSTYRVPQKSVSADVQKKIFTSEQYQEIKGWLVKYEDQ